MPKLFIDKKDTAAAIAEKITRTTGTTITLVIPRGSKLADSNHLGLLKKHTEELGKTLIIESIDENILELAAKHHIQRIHPLFEGGEKQPMFSDIRPHGLKKQTKQVAAEEEIEEDEADEIKEIEETKEEEVEEEEEEVVKKHRLPRLSFGRKKIKKVEKEEEPLKEEVSEETEESEEEGDYEYEENDEDLDYVARKRKRYVVVAGLGALLLIGFGAWGVTRALGRVDISIVLKKTSWQANLGLVADKSLNAFKGQGAIIPGMLFTETKNTTQLFKASGKKETSQKATAKVTIYNGYDSSPQTLVATTRLATPDGKIFRLDSRVTVPGAKLANGKITPVGVEATVTADQPGKEYNIGPFEKMTIVGFKGTPKYDGFYGTMKDKASGGAVGELPYPTDEDIAQAQEKTKATLESALDINIRRRIPEEFKILKDASALQIAKMTVNKSTDDQGNFSVIGEGRLSVLAFKEKDVQSVLESNMHGDTPDLSFRDLKISYDQVKPDFSNGKLRMTVKAEAVLTSPFSEETLLSNITGKSVEDARKYLANQVGLEEAKIGIWPPWLWSLPASSARISLSVK